MNRIAKLVGFFLYSLVNRVERVGRPYERELMLYVTHVYHRFFERTLVSTAGARHFGILAVARRIQGEREVPASHLELQSLLMSVSAGFHGSP